jgi:adenosylmethionine-8-amino-7-oxononanoate aminotransferase
MIGKNNIWLPYTQMQNAPEQLEVQSAAGVRIKLKDGRELIDGIASWWSAAHGYNHPHLIAAIKKQAEILPHVMLAGLANEPAYHLAAKLSKLSQLPKVFFSDSGSTAVEVAMKMALQYFINQNNRQKNKFISFKNAYHGDTLGCMSLSDTDQGMHKKFSNYLTPNFNWTLPGNLQELNQFEDQVKKVQDQVAAIIIEPLVQCAGGMKFHSAEILKALYQIAQRHQLLFIADECATGFWRSGEYFACNQAGIVPDIMILGKALTGGTMTLAATLASEAIYQQFLSPDIDQALMHGPTFMGNALACAAANASLELFALEDYSAKVRVIEKTLLSELNKCQKFPQVKAIRVKGAIGVIETNQGREAMLSYRKQAVAKSVWLRPFGGVIYLMPPLIISQADLVKLTDAIYQILAEEIS